MDTPFLYISYKLTTDANPPTTCAAVAPAPVPYTDAAPGLRGPPRPCKGGFKPKVVANLLLPLSNVYPA